MADGIKTDVDDLKSLTDELSTPLENSAVKKVLDEFGQKLVNDLKSSLSAKGKKVTGNLFNSIQVKVNMMGDTYNIELNMADYWEYVDKGRKPGKQPPVNSILKWVRSKPSFGGVGKRPESVAFGIAKNIGKFGIKPSNFYSDVINDGRLLKLEDDIAEAVKNNLLK